MVVFQHCVVATIVSRKHQRFLIERLHLLYQSDGRQPQPCAIQDTICRMRNQLELKPLTEYSSSGLRLPSPQQLSLE